MEKYGFVYIWYDRKHRRYYIGSHWGTENDNYICSSHWMIKSYKRRPEDFRRKIIKIISNILIDIESQLKNPNSPVLQDQFNLKESKFYKDFVLDSNMNSLLYSCINILINIEP